MYTLSSALLSALFASVLSAAEVPQAPVATSSYDDSKPLPLIIWHGLGDKSEPSSTITSSALLIMRV